MTEYIIINNETYIYTMGNHIETRNIKEDMGGWVAPELVKLSLDNGYKVADIAITEKGFSWKLERA